MKNVLLILSLLFTQLIRAQVNINEVQVGKKSPKFSGLLLNTVSSNFYEPSSESSKQNVSVDAIINYFYDSKNIIRYVGGANKALTQGQEGRVNDGFLAWVKPSLKRYSAALNVGSQFRLGIPLTKESVRRDSRITSVSVAPTLSGDLSKIFKLPGLSYFYLLNASRNFHTYQENRLGQSNIQHSLGHLMFLSYSFSDRWALTFIPSFSQRWNYNNRYMEPRYGLDESIGYMLTNHMWFSVGHNNTSTIVNNQNGSDQGVNLYDKRSSTFYGMLTYQF